MEQCSILGCTGAGGCLCSLMERMLHTWMHRRHMFADESRGSHGFIGKWRVIEHIHMDSDRHVSAYPNGPH